MPTVDPIILRGRLLRAQAVQTYGLSQLSITLELPASTQGGAPTTVECLMATGRTAAAWKAAQHAEAVAYLHMPCEVRGADLRLAGTQLWLLGVTRLRALPAEALAPATDGATQVAELLGPRMAAMQAQPLPVPASAAQAQRAQVAA